MTSSPLVVTEEDQKGLSALRDLAGHRPVDIPGFEARLKTPEGELAHRAQMQAQTRVIATGPYEFWVTFSIETGHGAGVCRHLSMSVRRENRVPSPAAVELIAALMGFTGGLSDWYVWLEKLQDGGAAVNAVQPVGVQEAGHA